MPLNIDWQQILLHLLNFAILAFGLYILLYNPVKKFMKSREDYYRERDEKAEKSLDDAEKKSEEYSQRLSEIDKEISDKKKEADIQLEETREIMLNQARSEADAILADARKKAQEEKNRIIEDANSQIKDMVAEISEKVILKTGASEAYEQFLSAVEKDDDGKNNS